MLESRDESPQTIYATKPLEPTGKCIAEPQNATHRPPTWSVVREDYLRRMEAKKPPKYMALLHLVRGALAPPKGKRRIALAYIYGLFCHLVFGFAVAAMIMAMFFGMSESLGRVPAPWSYVANLFLVLQFPILHSLLLSKKGRWALNWLAPGDVAGTLSTTTFATVASVQLFVLFAFWTPTGVIWWRAEGTVFYTICGAYAVSWVLLIKASYDAGAEVQSGALGWMSLAQNKRPLFPDMPVDGLFRLIRQPIYVSFALTLWTVPVWTPDQLFLAIVLTAYCLLAPRLKEKRFAERYGERFERYRKDVPYIIPKLRNASQND